MANLFSTPKYIKAGSPDGLRRLMFETQNRDRMQYKFFDIGFVNGSWYAWYFYDPKTPNEQLSAATELIAKEGNNDGISKG